MGTSRSLPSLAHLHVATMMRKAVIGALAASALAFPALAVRDHVATALVVMNGDQDPSDVCLPKDGVRAVRDAALDFITCSTEAVMDYLSDSDELCMNIQGKMMEFMMMDESDQVRTVGEAVGECVTTALMPIIDTDGDGCASAGEVADFVLIAPDLFDMSPREVKEISCAIDILLTQSLGKNYFCPEDVHKIGSIIDYIEENEEELGELVD